MGRVYGNGRPENKTLSQQTLGNSSTNNNEQSRTKQDHVFDEKGFQLGKLCHKCYFRSMSTMNISLPEALRSFVDSQVSDGDYTSSSEYVRELLRKEQDRVRL